MWTSRTRHALVAESVIAVVLAAALSLAVSPSDPAMHDLQLHPAWFIALVLAARSGVRGLLAIPAIVLGVSGAELAVGSGELVMLDQLGSGDCVVVASANAIIAAIGAGHETRKAALRAQLGEATERTKSAEIGLEALVDAAAALRDRCDRTECSLVFLADIVRRLDGSDPRSASLAALDLMIARTGARSGFVQLVDANHRLRTVAARGDRKPRSELFHDRVVQMALVRGVAVAAHEIATVRVDDSDLAAPIVDRGEIVAVLALRGLRFPALTPMLREDLAVVAGWVASSFARTTGSRPRRSAM